LSQPLLFCFPNADAGSRALVARAEALCAEHAGSKIFVNLNPIDYWGLLRVADLLIGNSSSGIMETPALELPTVNVGRRQEGRERAANIIDVPAHASEILAAARRALTSDFRLSLTGMENPYGDGHAAERIADILATVPIDERLLRKAALPPLP
jgi:UDP-N-acetylglucosamine 2-epimerase (non-hydrolysing)/GDP/UDP-N,N'-diacetylbacillosamine 2-epimerase (hydrolysing)